MLRDLNGSDPIRLKYIVKKVQSMASKAPNLVLETIHDYFADNPEVGLAQATPERQGEQRGGLEPKAGSTLGFSVQQPHGLGQVNLLVSNGLSGEGEKWAHRR